jgi:hypothetical protein
MFALKPHQGPGGEERYSQCDPCRLRHREDKRLRVSEDIVCECGRSMKKSSKRNHLLTIEHQSWLADQAPPAEVIQSHKKSKKSKS